MARCPGRVRKTGGVMGGVGSGGQPVFSSSHFWPRKTQRDGGKGEKGGGGGASVNRWRTGGGGRDRRQGKEREGEGGHQRREMLTDRQTT